MILYDEKILAQYIVEKCCKENKNISNLTLQKLLYLVNREFLKNGCEAITYVQAWKFGPCFPSVYYQYCTFGNLPLTVYEYSNEDYRKFDIPLNIVDEIVEKYRELEPWEIQKIVCPKNGAWERNFQKHFNGIDCIRNVIPHKDIKKEIEIL